MAIFGKDTFVRDLAESGCGNGEGAWPKYDNAHQNSGVEFWDKVSQPITPTKLK